jgi:hypothetical protein
VSKPTLIVTQDFTYQFNEMIKKFKKDNVLVGIPETTTTRSDDSSINNATILAINEFGSPANNIPSRPVMKIGIKNAQDEIAEQFKLAAQKVWEQGYSALDTYLNRAGIIASSSIKKVINSQDGILPPAESTLKARRAAGFSGSKSLVITGQLRNSITWVVRSG